MSDVTAKSTLSWLNGSIIEAKGKAITYGREGNEDGKAKAEAFVERLEYAKAAVSVFKQDGKSPVKELARRARATPAVEEEDPSDEEMDEAEGFEP